MAGTQLDTILQQLDAESLTAQLELDKAMHVEGYLADYFDQRDENPLSKAAQDEILIGYGGAAKDNDIVHDYIILAAGHIKAVRSALEALYRLYHQQ